LRAECIRVSLKHDILTCNSKQLSRYGNEKSDPLYRCVVVSCRCRDLFVVVEICWAPSLRRLSLQVCTGNPSCARFLSSPSFPHLCLYYLSPSLPPTLSTLVSSPGSYCTLNAHRMLCSRSSRNKHRLDTPCRMPHAARMSQPCIRSGLRKNVFLKERFRSHTWACFPCPAAQRVSFPSPFLLFSAPSFSALESQHRAYSRVFFADTIADAIHRHSSPGRK
jgi:hypothetical protein